MSDPLNTVRWLVGFRRVEGVSVLPAETIALSLRAFANVPFETNVPGEIHQSSGWASQKAAAMKLRRKGWWPFTPMINVRWRERGGEMAVVFSEGLPLGAWIKIVSFVVPVTFLLAVALDEMSGRVWLGVLVGLGLFVANRWVGRRDWDVLIEHFTLRAGVLPGAEPRPAQVVARPTVQPTFAAAPARFADPIVQSGGGGVFGRRRA